MKKSTLALAFAVILAVLAVVAVRNYLTREKKEIRKGSRTVKILVAAETIPPYESVRRSWLEEFEIPERCLLDEMVLATDIGRIRGKKSAKEILRGKLLLEPYFREAGPTHRVTIPDGMRILTVSVNSVTGIAGLISPGDYIDVIWTNRTGGGGGGGGAASESTFTLFSQILVYAIDDISTVGYRSGRRGRGRATSSTYTTVTLLMYPLECELLTFARSQGDLTLTKRAATDGGSPRSPGVDSSHMDQLIDSARQKREGGR